MTEAIGARNMTEMSKASPALFMALGAQLYTRLGLANRMGPAFNTVVTNVPGPPVHLHSAGARLESMMGLICLNDGLGLAHVVQSYVKEATISFTADRDLLPDPQFYIACLVESFEELRDAAKAMPAPSAKPAKPAPVGKAKPAVTKPAAKAAPRGTKPAAKRSPSIHSVKPANRPAKSGSKTPA
jgi:diacylglycerol O-acyltransferase